MNEDEPTSMFGEVVLALLQLLACALLAGNILEYLVPND